MSGCPIHRAFVSRDGWDEYSPDHAPYQLPLDPQAWLETSLLRRSPKARPSRTGQSWFMQGFSISRKKAVQKMAISTRLTVHISTARCRKIATTPMICWWMR